jgi:ATP-dependent protease HslVU (ClpYQ) peptidase subunit
MDNIPNIPANESIEELLSSQEDKDDEKINRYKQEILNAAEDLFKDKNFDRSLAKLKTIS